jgi:hypothetical protein
LGGFETKPRIVETDQGIQGEFNVHAYDTMQRHLRDRGWIETIILREPGGALLHDASRT